MTTVRVGNTTGIRLTYIAVLIEQKVSIRWFAQVFGTVRKRGDMGPRFLPHGGRCTIEEDGAEVLSRPCEPQEVLWLEMPHHLAFCFVREVCHQGTYQDYSLRTKYPTACQASDATPASW